jgi:hypothetical protein
MMEPTQYEQGDESCPNLDVDGILAGSDEGFDLEVLFEGLEEEFDLPSFFVNVGDGGGSEFEVVGEEGDLALVLFVPDHNPPQEVGTFFFGVGAGEFDDLVGDDVAILRDGQTLDDSVVGVLFHSGDEVDFSFGPVGEELVVVEGHIHGDDGLGFEFEESGGLDLVFPSGSDMDEAGQVVAVVEEDIDLDPSLGASELGPGKEVEAERDDGGIEGEKQIFKAELVSGAEAPLVVEVIEGGVEEVAVEFGGAMSIGVGKGGTGDGAEDAEVAELAETALEPPGDLAERIGGREVTEDHGDKLGPTTEALGPTLGLMPADEGSEFRTGNVMKDLTEKTRNLYHKAVLLAVVEDGFLTIPSCHAKEDFSFSYFGH